MYPYAYFALNLSVEYSIHKGCIPDWEEADEICDNIEP